MGIVPCATDPQVSLTFGGKSFPISLDTFNFGQLEAGSTQCVGGVMASSGLPAFIVGDVFLQNVYTGEPHINVDDSSPSRVRIVFDVGNTRVGFADLA